MHVDIWMCGESWYYKNLSQFSKLGIHCVLLWFAHMCMYMYIYMYVCMYVGVIVVGINWDIVCFLSFYFFLSFSFLFPFTPG